VAAASKAGDAAGSTASSAAIGTASGTAGSTAGCTASGAANSAASGTAGSASSSTAGNTAARAPTRVPAKRVTVDDLDGFDALIDTRSPAEFAADHIPGAINLPVLDDAERASVGTLYAQVSPFAARKVGAALVSRNIARHIEGPLRDFPKQWRPLVYCWRGGQRSGALTLVLAEVGWGARQLEGGYRAFRRRVIDDLAVLPARCAFIVLHGPTGSGKTALLEALQAEGAQVLNLEALAHHRGSVLGGTAAALHEPGDSSGPGQQPGQKSFESAIWDALRHFDPARPVYVESESRRIGRLSIPAELFERLIGSSCLRIAAPIEARVAHLLERYGDIYQHPAVLSQRMDFFLPLHGRKTIAQWREWIAAGQWADLARAMVANHYDPAYRRGGDALYRRAADGQVLEMARLDRDAIIGAARAIMQSTGTGNAQ
jgi:tRNA 2-selenouridine synthase